MKKPLTLRSIGLHHFPPSAVNSVLTISHLSPFFRSHMYEFDGLTAGGTGIAPLPKSRGLFCNCFLIQGLTGRFVPAAVQSKVSIGRIHNLSIKSSVLHNIVISPSPTPPSSAIAGSPAHLGQDYATSVARPPSIALEEGWHF